MTPPPVIITRAEPGASETAQRLKRAELDPIVSPVLEIVPITPPPQMDLSDVQAVLLTSANGARAFAAMTDRRDMAAYCVGPSTADAARAAGWAAPVNADGDAATLYDRVCAELDPAGGALLHIANQAAAGRLCERFIAAGFTARFAALYRTDDAPALSPEVCAAIGNGAIVLIHSAKGAAAFQRLANAAGLSLSGCKAVAVSAQAAGPLAPDFENRLYLASRPNEAALLDALNAAVSRL